MCPGTQWISVSMPASRRFPAHWLIHLARCCPGQGSRCPVRRMAACKSVKKAIFITPCVCRLSDSLLTPGVRVLWFTIFHWRLLFRPVPRWLRNALQPSRCFHTTAAPTQPSSDRNTSGHIIHTPPPTLASVSLAQRLTSLFAAVSSLTITVLTSGSSSGLGQCVVSASWPRWCSLLMTVHICAPDVGWLYAAFCFQPWHALANLVAN